MRFAGSTSSRPSPCHRPRTAARSRSAFGEHVRDHGLHTNGPFARAANPLMRRPPRPEGDASGPGLRCRDEYVGGRSPCVPLPGAARRHPCQVPRGRAVLQRGRDDRRARRDSPRGITAVSHKAIDNLLAPCRKAPGNRAEPCGSSTRTTTRMVATLSNGGDIEYTDNNEKALDAIGPGCVVAAQRGCGCSPRPKHASTACSSTRPARCHSRSSRCQPGRVPSGGRAVEGLLRRVLGPGATWTDHAGRSAHSASRGSAASTSSKGWRRRSSSCRAPVRRPRTRRPASPSSTTRTGSTSPRAGPSLRHGGIAAPVLARGPHARTDALGQRPGKKPGSSHFKANRNCRLVDSGPSPIRNGRCPRHPRSPRHLRQPGR